jgi:hypothetical protein
MKKQTTVEWIKKQLDFLEDHMSPDDIKWLFSKVEAMEKEQIVHCYEQAYRDGYIDNGKSGEAYYNETYGGDK